LARIEGTIAEGDKILIMDIYSKIT